MKDKYSSFLNKLSSPEPAKSLADKIITQAANSRQQHLKPGLNLESLLKLSFASFLGISLLLLALIWNSQPENINNGFEMADNFYIYQLPSEDELDDAELISYLSLTLGNSD